MLARDLLEAVELTHAPWSAFPERTPLPRAPLVTRALLTMRVEVAGCGQLRADEDHVPPGPLPASMAVSAVAVPNAIVAVAAVTASFNVNTESTTRTPWHLPGRVHVPVRHVLEPVVRLDRLVHVHAVHPLGDRVLVPPRVEEDRGCLVRHQHLEVDVGRKT